MVAIVFDSSRRDQRLIRLSIIDRGEVALRGVCS